MSARIHFIGTVHTDPKGPERLWKALEYEKPDAIAVECSPDLWRYIQSGEWFKAEKRILNKYRKKGLQNSLYQFILGELKSINFEPRVSLEYGRKYNVPIHLVDSNKSLERVLVAHNSPLQGDVKDIDDKLTKGYRLLQAEEAYTDFYDLFTGPFPDALSEEHKLVEPKLDLMMGRDDYAEERVREIIKDGIKVGVVYGLYHCLNDLFKETLFSRLRDLTPTRATLKWYDDK